MTNLNVIKLGFSLIESLVSVVIFGICFIAFMSFSSYGIKATQKYQERTNAHLIANMILEDLQLDISNIDSYNKFNLNANESFDSFTNKYKWKELASKRLLAPTSQDDRKISISNIKINNQDKKLVEVIIKSLNGSMSINVKKIY